MKWRVAAFLLTGLLLAPAADAQGESHVCTLVFAP